MTIPNISDGSAPVITFYSYKGGVGRSMAVLNTGALIASRGFRVLIIDFDLEAPGLSHLSVKNFAADDLSPRVGVAELLHDAVCRQGEADLFTLSPADLATRYTFPYKLPTSLRKSKEASLSIMPSGCLGNGYTTLLEKLDLKGLYEDFGNPPVPRSVGQSLILAFKAVLTRSGAYDYILIDSRTGHSEVAGVCTRDLADHRMVLSGLNTQNVTGTAEFLTNLRNTFEQAKISLRTPDIILSPIPSSEEDLISRRLKTAADEFKTALGTKPVLNLFIPYHPRLALTEQAYVPPLPTSPLRQAYLAIETRLFKSIGHTDEAFQPRFTEFIENGKGDAALKLLQHWVKLQGTPGVPDSQKFSFFYYDVFGQKKDICKKVYHLPEALEILTLIAQKSRGLYKLAEIAQDFHTADPIKAVAFDKVLLKLPSLDSDFLGNYANFLTDICKDHDAAEAFYKLALEADPKSANKLGNYANFLADIRKDDDLAETFYRRAIEVDPAHANNLGNYATFLTNIRRDHDAAETFYKPALEIDPKSAVKLGNYGQFLIGRGKVAEGLGYLRSAWVHRDGADKMDHAELAYSLWLGTCLAGEEESAWERVFKHFIEAGFNRSPWNFDAMLRAAEDKLEPEDFKHAQTLAAAFLDEAKLPALEKFPRWKQLQPLDPRFVNPDGSISR